LSDDEDDSVPGLDDGPDAGAPGEKERQEEPDRPTEDDQGSVEITPASKRDDAEEVVDAEIVESMRQIAREEASMVASMSISGPLPWSGEMEGYKRVDPGLPSAIVSASTEERHHRHDLERMTTKASILFAGVGHLVGAMFVVGALILGYVAIENGDTLTGAAALIAAVVPIILAMLTGGRGGGALGRGSSETPPSDPVE